MVILIVTKPVKPINDQDTGSPLNKSSIISDCPEIGNQSNHLGLSSTNIITTGTIAGSIMIIETIDCASLKFFDWKATNNCNAEAKKQIGNSNNNNAKIVKASKLKCLNKWLYHFLLDL